MSTEGFILVLIGAVLATYAAIALTAWFRMRGTRVVTCPDTNHSAAVDVDAGHAAVSAIWEHPDVRLKNCSRWPDRQDCDQPCVAQIAAAPHETLVSTILANYYVGKRCSICKRAIPPVHANEPKPGLFDTSTGRLLAWSDVDPAELPDALQPLQPVCENCMVIETFRRTHPDMVTDRPTRPPFVQPR